MLALAARGLGPLKDEVVFVGGATIELYLAQEAAPKVRATDDVDCVVEVATRNEFHDLEEKLRALGFKHPAGKAPICRWEYKTILVDVMPSDGAILGFKNRWYPAGIENAIATRISDGLDIKIFSLPYLVASKIEAFKGRGRGDFIASTDMEDVIALADGVPDFAAQIGKAAKDVRSYLQDYFRQFLADERFLDALQGHLTPAAGPGRAARARAVLSSLMPTA